MSLIEEARSSETRATSKKRLGIFVVMLIVMIMMALGYYYTEAPDEGANTVVVAVRGYLSVEQKDALTQQFNLYAPASDQQPVTLKVFEFPATSSGTSSSDASKMFNQLLGEIKTGQSDLFLLDRYIFDMLGDERLFADLSEEYAGDPAVTSKYLYAIADKPFADAAGLDYLPEVYLALRSSKSSAVNKNAQTLEKYAYRSTLLEHIAHNVPQQVIANQQPETE